MFIVRTMFFFSFSFPYKWNIEQTNQTLFWFKNYANSSSGIKTMKDGNSLFLFSVSYTSCQPNRISYQPFFFFASVIVMLFACMFIVVWRPNVKEKKQHTRTKKCLTISVTSSFRSLVVFYLYTLWYNDSTYIFFTVYVVSYIYNLYATDRKWQAEIVLYMYDIFRFFDVVYPRCRGFFFIENLLV